RGVRGPGEAARDQVGGGPGVPARAGSASADPIIGYRTIITGEESVLEIVDKLGSLGEGRKRKRLEEYVRLVNGFEEELQQVMTPDLPDRTRELQERLRDGEDLDDVLPEAFALVRESAKRTIGQRPFDVQVMGAVVLHQGNIA